MMTHIDDHIEDKARTDSGYAIANAILQLARAQRETGTAVKNLDLSRIAEGLETAGGTIGDAIAQFEA